MKIKSKCIELNVLLRKITPSPTEKPEIKDIFTIYSIRNERFVALIQ